MKNDDSQGWVIGTVLFIVFIGLVIIFAPQPFEDIEHLESAVTANTKLSMATEDELRIDFYDLQQQNARLTERLSLLEQAKQPVAPRCKPTKPATTCAYGAKYQAITDVQPQRPAKACISSGKPVWNADGYTICTDDGKPFMPGHTYQKGPDGSFRRID